VSLRRPPRCAAAGRKPWTDEREHPAPGLGVVRGCCTPRRPALWVVQFRGRLHRGGPRIREISRKPRALRCLRHAAGCAHGPHQELMSEHQELIFGLLKLMFGHQEQKRGHQELIFGLQDLMFGHQEQKCGHQELIFGLQELMCPRQELILADPREARPPLSGSPRPEAARRGRLPMAYCEVQRTPANSLISCGSMRVAKCT
jgi:hypothetical protein